MLLSQLNKQIKKLAVSVRARIIIAHKYRKQFDICRQAINLADSFSQDPQKKLAWDEDDDLSKIILVSIARNVHRLESIIILCRRGFAKDAIPLVRSLFEELVDIKYMRADKTRVRDFLDYDVWQRVKLSKIAGAGLVTEAQKEKLEKRRKELLDSWLKIRERFLCGKEKKECNRWTKKDVRQVANEVKLGESYDYIFGYLSHYIHHSAITADEYVLGREGDKVALEVGATEKLVREVLPTASAMFVDLLSQANEEYSLGCDRQLQSLSEDLVKDKERYKTHE